MVRKIAFIVIALGIVAGFLHAGEMSKSRMQDFTVVIDGESLKDDEGIKPFWWEPNYGYRGIYDQGRYSGLYWNQPASDPCFGLGDEPISAEPDGIIVHGQDKTPALHIIQESAVESMKKR